MCVKKHLLVSLDDSFFYYLSYCVAVVGDRSVIASDKTIYAVVFYVHLLFMS